MEAEPALRAQRATLGLLRYYASCGTDVGDLVAGASARCKQLDEAAQRLVLSGWRSPAQRAPQSLEADVIATTTGLFYVVPRAGYVWSRPWPQLRIGLERMPKFGLGRAKVAVTDGLDELILVVSPPSAAADLVRIAHDLIRDRGRSEEVAEVRHERETKMAYGLVLEFNGVGKEEYDAVNEKLGIDLANGTGDWPAGLTSHAAGTTPTGLCIFEVWESKALQEAFMSSRLGPALGALSLPPPARTTELDIVGYNAP